MDPEHISRTSLGTERVTEDHLVLKKYASDPKHIFPTPTTSAKARRIISEFEQQLAARGQRYFGLKSGSNSNCDLVSHGAPPFHIQGMRCERARPWCGRAGRRPRVGERTRGVWPRGVWPREVRPRGICRQVFTQHNAGSDRGSLALRAELLWRSYGRREQ